MDTSTVPENTEPQVVFRSSKKRKQFRQRAEETDTNADDATTHPQAPATTTANDGTSRTDPRHNATTEAKGLSVSDALRLRNARKSRPKGVGFRPEGPSIENIMAEAPAPKDDLTEALELGMARRFAPPAGLVGELVNKHMEEYIESELVRRHAADKAAAQQQDSQQPSAANAAAAAAAAAASGSADPAKHAGERPTMQGRLQEVDLGEEVRARNAAMTEQARRRLAGEAVEDEEEGGRKRPRVGKDGKPWRGRKRRASDDVKRDEMVEALMRENRLDIYEPPAQVETTAQSGTDDAADERIAEEFRREFMDAMAERRNQRRKAPAPVPRPGVKQEEVLKGPKLGGSRNARAAMRDLLLSQQEKDKKRR